MIVRLKLVMMDGTTPTSGDPLVPFVQHLDGAAIDLPAIPAGTDVIYEFECVGQNNQPFPMDGYAGLITARHGRSSAPLFANAIAFSGSSGTSFSTHADTTGEKPRTCIYDVQVKSPSAKVDQPLPESHFKIIAAVGDADADVTEPGPAMALVGLPSVAAGDLDAVLVPTSRSPLTFAWKRRKRGSLVFAQAGALYQDVDISALELTAGGYSVELAVHAAADFGGVEPFVCARDDDDAYPADLAADGFRVQLVDAADCTIFYVVEAL